MPEQDDEFLKRLLPIFKEEARERVTAIVTHLARLQGSPGEACAALVAAAFRETHSLKAAAGAVGRREIGLVCQSMESVLAVLHQGGAPPSADLAKALCSAADAVEDFLGAIDEAPDPRRLARASDVARALDAVCAHTASGRLPSKPAPRTARVMVPPPMPGEPPERSPDRGRGALPAAPDTVRVSVRRLDALLLEAEGILSEKLAARYVASEIRAIAQAVSTWRKEFGKAFAAAAVLPDLAHAELGLRSIEARLAATAAAASAEARGLQAKADDLLYGVKQILTLPCGHLLQPLHRVARDVAREQGKEVAVEITGAELEFDRSVLDEIKDPLLHLVRNCVDHGVEMPEHRLKIGKRACALLRLGVAALEGGKAELVIADDGAGIATRKLAAAAMTLGLLSADKAQASDAELLPLVFEPGVSTSSAITDLSGRGLGLTIVRETVERIGGSVSVESSPGLGTTFRLVVPLTLATYRGIQVRVGDRVFVLPTLGVERVVGMDGVVVSAAGGRATIDIAGASLPLVALRDMLELPAAPPGAGTGRQRVAVVLGIGKRRVAFEVDALEAEQEVLAKPFGKCLRRVRNVLGATILPTGAIAPILNVEDLLKSAARSARRNGSSNAGSGKEVAVGDAR